MKGVQCYELFGGIALKIHTFSFYISFFLLMSTVDSIFSIVIFYICISLYESTLLSYCNPKSKLDLPTLREGSREGKNATEQIKNMTLARK